MIKPIINTTIKASSQNYTKCNSRKIKYIIIHSTGHVATTKNYALALKNNKCNASFHYIIGDKEIYRCIEYNNIAWHIVNPNNTYKIKMVQPKNSNSIGIEMSKLNSNTGKVDETTIKLTGQLVRYLMYLLDIPPNRILRHYDVLSKPCPTGFLTQEKRNKLKLKLLIPHTTIKNAQNYNCIAKVICDNKLNVRNNRPINNKLGKKVDTIENNTFVKLGYVYDNWSSIFYLKNNKILNGFVNINYPKIMGASISLCIY